MDEIGKELRHLRKQKGITQRALADQSGIDRVYVVRIEKGNTNISLRVLKQMAGALGKEVKIIFTTPKKTKPRQ